MCDEVRVPDEAWLPEQASPEPFPETTGEGRKPTEGALVLVSTPIGNLGDMTHRALAALRGSDLVLCEDTRLSARLLAHYDIRVRTAPLHEHNESASIDGVLGRLARGDRIALISDAGTPLVSDPGYRLVRSAIEAGHAVQATPGANAATMALVLSGLPPHPFLFMGFASAKQAARRSGFVRLRAAERAGLSATLIFYEAPHRLAETLADMANIFGDRPAAVARELTKKFEEVRRAKLFSLAAHYATNEARGEITLVIGPAEEEIEDEAALDALLATALQTQSVREAAAGVAEATGLPRRQVYARALALKGAT